MQGHSKGRRAGGENGRTLARQAALVVGFKVGKDVVQAVLGHLNGTAGKEVASEQIHGHELLALSKPAQQVSHTDTQHSILM